MPKEDAELTLLELCKCARNKRPKYIDCRFIYVEESLIDAEYKILSKEKTRLRKFAKPEGRGLLLRYEHKFASYPVGSGNFVSGQVQKRQNCSPSGGKVEIS